MPLCKFCGKPFAWGNDSGKWVPLVPPGEEGDLDRSFQDENGLLRAKHRDMCTYTPAVAVVKLAVPIPASDIVQVPRVVLPQPSKKRGRRAAGAHDEQHYSDMSEGYKLGEMDYPF